MKQNWYKVILPTKILTKPRWANTTDISQAFTGLFMILLHVYMIVFDDEPKCSSRYCE